jgi:hypothetical protein
MMVVPPAGLLDFLETKCTTHHTTYLLDDTSWLSGVSACMNLSHLITLLKMISKMPASPTSHPHPAAPAPKIRFLALASPGFSPELLESPAKEAS